MAAQAGNCPICTNYYEALHWHHIIPRELTLNGTKGVDGPTVYLCGSWHDMLHRSAKAQLAKNPSGKQYFTEQQRKRAEPILKVLVAAMLSNQGNTSGQIQKIVLEFDHSVMERLHAAKIDYGATNLARFVETIVLDFLRRSGQ